LFFAPDNTTACWRAASSAGVIGPQYRNSDILLPFSRCVAELNALAYTSFNSLKVVSLILAGASASSFLRRPDTLAINSADAIGVKSASLYGMNSQHPAT